eukprot:363040-Chlamydomonas_euryale.AAC.3
MRSAPADCAARSHSAALKPSSLGSSTHHFTLYSSCASVPPSSQSVPCKAAMPCTARNPAGKAADVPVNGRDSRPRNAHTRRPLPSTMTWSRHVDPGRGGGGGAVGPSAPPKRGGSACSACSAWQRSAPPAAPGAPPESDAGTRTPPTPPPRPAPSGPSLPPSCSRTRAPSCRRQSSAAGCATRKSPGAAAGAASKPGGCTTAAADATAATAAAATPLSRRSWAPVPPPSASFNDRPGRAGLRRESRRSWNAGPYCSPTAARSRYSCAASSGSTAAARQASALHARISFNGRPGAPPNTLSAVPAAAARCPEAAAAAVAAAEADAAPARRAAKLTTCAVRCVCGGARRRVGCALSGAAGRERTRTLPSPALTSASSTSVAASPGCGSTHGDENTTFASPSNSACPASPPLPAPPAAPGPLPAAGRRSVCAAASAISKYAAPGTSDRPETTWSRSHAHDGRASSGSRNETQLVRTPPTPPTPPAPLTPPSASPDAVAATALCSSGWLMGSTPGRRSRLRHVTTSAVTAALLAGFGPGLLAAGQATAGARIACALVPDIPNDDVPAAHSSAAPRRCSGSRTEATPPTASATYGLSDLRRSPGVSSCPNAAAA